MRSGCEIDWAARGLLLSRLPTPRHDAVTRDGVGCRTNAVLAPRGVRPQIVNCAMIGDQASPAATPANHDS